MEDLTKAGNLSPEAIEEMRQRFKEAEREIDRILEKHHGTDSDKAVAFNSQNKDQR